MIFAEILEKRIKYYAENNPEAIYNLYHKNSKFKEFFPTFEVYKTHFDKLISDHLPINVEVFRENQTDDKAEALYIEIFKYGETIKKFYSKTTFTLENNEWLIIDEKREEQVIKD